MAIDPRISLSRAPTVNVGQRFGQALQNVRNLDLIGVNRELAPLQQEQAQMQVDLMKAQQPANILTAERAASELTQTGLDLSQEQQLGVQIAQSLKPLLDSNNDLGVVAELTRLNQQRPELQLTDEIELIQKDPAAFRVMNDSILQLGGAITPQQRVATKSFAPITDTETGQVSIPTFDPNTREAKLITIEGAKQLTPEQKRKSETESKIRDRLLGDAADISKSAFDELGKVKSSISTIDEAIKAIDDGASSGAISKFFPSFKQATIELENAAQRMGLDVISATTFGALSEGELKLAMDTASPKNLKPKDLIKWFTDRKKAKMKLGRELEKMAMALGRGKVTIAEYLEKNATFDERSDQDIFAEYGL